NNNGSSNNAVSNMQPNYFPQPQPQPQPLPPQFQLPAQYQLPSNTQPPKFISIAGGVNINDQQSQQQQSQSTIAATAATVGGANSNTSNSSNNNNRSGRRIPIGTSNGRPTSEKGSECWYYKAERCTLGDGCNFLHI